MWGIPGRAVSPGHTRGALEASQNTFQRLRRGYETASCQELRAVEELRLGPEDVICGWVELSESCHGQRSRVLSVVPRGEVGPCRNPGGLHFSLQILQAGWGQSSRLLQR